MDHTTLTDVFYNPGGVCFLHGTRRVLICDRLRFVFKG